MTIEYFCQISSKSIVTISSYTVSKLGPFLRHSVDSLNSLIVCCEAVYGRQSQRKLGFLYNFFFKRHLFIGLSFSIGTSGPPIIPEPCSWTPLGTSVPQTRPRLVGMYSGVAPQRFLADRTNGRAYATVLRPSVVVCL